MQIEGHYAWLTVPEARWIYVEAGSAAVPQPDIAEELVAARRASLEQQRIGAVTDRGDVITGLSNQELAAEDLHALDASGDWRHGIMLGTTEGRLTWLAWVGILGYARVKAALAEVEAQAQARLVASLSPTDMGAALSKLVDWEEYNVNLPDPERLGLEVLAVDDFEAYTSLMDELLAVSGILRCLGEHGR